jgi:PAS domain S-box-containing protein
MHKCRVEDIVGSAILGLYSPSNHEHVRRNVQKADQIGYASFEAAMARKGEDRAAFPVQVDIVSVLGEDGEVLHRVVTAQDITERKQTEENLRRFQLLAEHSRDIILFMGHQDERILDANAAAVQAYGYSRDELLSLSIRDLRGRDTLSQTDIQIAQADAEGILFETIHQRKDGTTFPVEVSSQGATIGGVRTLISIVRDITERKNAEKALTESEARFRSLFEQSADAILLLENGVFIDCNQATIQMMRARNKQELLSLHPSKLSPQYQPDGRSSVEKADEMVRLALEQGCHRFEWIHRRLDGTDFPVEVLLTSISTEDRQLIHTVWRDITERKQIEQALQAAHDELERKVQERTAALSDANALLQALMDNMPDHIYFKDIKSRFIRNSRSQANLLGLNDPSEAVGKTDFDFFPHAAKSYAEEQEVMRSGTPLVDFEEWVLWPDGREMWVSTTKMPLRNAEGETIGIFGISRDITERKRSEQAIRQLNADLEKQAEQLQAANKELEAFSYSVSHDLRAPLRAIDGYTRILVEDYESILDDEGKRICGVIGREARRMGQLIDDLLAFSRLGRKEMYSSKIDMKVLAASVFEELIKEEKRENIDFVLSDMPIAQGDSSLIRQVWVNLLSNALKFTSKKEGAVIEVGSKENGDETVYYVRDNGAGFDMEYSNKLFGVFQRLHSESEFSGTGVGLAIVQRIIRRHNGRVWGEGEIEKGATFYFSLPHKENLL